MGHLKAKGLEPHVAVALTRDGYVYAHLLVVSPAQPDRTVDQYLRDLAHDLRSRVLAKVRPDLDFADGSFFQFFHRQEMVAASDATGLLRLFAGEVLGELVGKWQKVTYLTVDGEGTKAARLTAIVLGEGLSSAEAQAQSKAILEHLRRFSASVFPTLQLSAESRVQVVPWPRTAGAETLSELQDMSSFLARGRVMLRLRTPDGKISSVPLELGDASLRALLEKGVVDPSLRAKLGQAAGVEATELPDGSTLAVTGLPKQAKGARAFSLKDRGWQQAPPMAPQELEDMSKTIAGALGKASGESFDPTKLGLKGVEGNRVLVDLPLGWEAASPGAARRILEEVAKIMDRHLGDRGQLPADGSRIHLTRAPAHWPNTLTFSGSRWSLNPVAEDPAQALKGRIARLLQKASGRPVDPGRMLLSFTPEGDVLLETPLDWMPKSPREGKELLELVSKLVDKALDDEGKKPAEGSGLRLSAVPGDWPSRIVFRNGKWVHLRPPAAAQYRRFVKGRYLLNLDRPRPLPKRAVLARAGIGKRDLGGGLFSNVQSMETDLIPVSFSLGLNERLTVTIHDLLIDSVIDPVVNNFTGQEQIGRFPVLDLRYVRPKTGSWDLAYGMYFASLKQEQREVLLPVDFEQVLAFYVAGERDLRANLSLVANLRYTFVNTDTPQGAPNTSAVGLGLGLDYKVNPRFLAQFSLQSSMLGEDAVGVLGTLQDTGPYVNLGVRYLIKPQLALEVSGRGLGRSDFSETRAVLSYLLLR